MSVFNPVIFEGEQVIGTVAGAPLSTDANNQVISGITVLEVSDTANATTTGATNALLTTMTITPAAGKYIAFFSAAINVNLAGNTATVSLFNNGVQDTATVRTISPFDGGALSAGSATGMVSIQRTIVVTTGSVTIEWNTSGGTSTCGPRTLTLLRVL